jgi:pimeloyl-ACP methyl ester carboxylesterase
VTAIPVLHRFLYRNYQSTKSAIRLWLADTGFQNDADVPEEIADVYATCAQQYGAEHAIRNLDAGRLGFDLEERMSTLTQPVALLWSDASLTQPPEWAEQLQARLPGASVTRLPNAGRLAAMESPEPVVDALREQLRSELRLFKES